MKTVIVDPNWLDEHGRIITKGPYLGNPTVGTTVRMLEVESGEYWYGLLELIDIKQGFTKLHIRPHHQSSYGGWIDYEPDAQD